MTDAVYKPFLTKEEAALALDDVYDFQVDYVDRVDLGESGPRQIPLTRGRHAALAIFNKLSHRAGLDVREITNYDAAIIGEIVDEATDIINAAFDVGEGPVTLDVAWEINKMHAEGYEWAIEYDGRESQYRVGVNHPEQNSRLTCVNDTLYTAIMGSLNLKEVGDKLP